MAMGNFRVPMEIGPLSGDRFRQITALVDTGATYTWIPRDVLDELGIQAEEEGPFILADGREVTYPIASVRVRLNRRNRTTVAVFGEAGSEPLMGAVTMEEFGLAADPVNRRLIRMPGLLKAGQA